LVAAFHRMSEKERKALLAEALKSSRDALTEQTYTLPPDGGGQPRCKPPQAARAIQLTVGTTRLQGAAGQRHADRDDRWLSIAWPPRGRAATQAITSLCSQPEERVESLTCIGKVPCLIAK
jgi:hypothetical protein